MPDIDLGMNLYDFNKQAMSQIEALDPIEFNRITEEIADTMFSNKDTKLAWMLLSNERKDYTVFIPLTKEGILKELRPTLRNRGLITDITKQEDGNYEIWIRDPETKENFVYYLFDYTFGLIQA